MGLRLVVQGAWSQTPQAEISYEFDQERVTIGRGGGADVRLPHPAVSSRHATIQHGVQGYTLVDHGSTNGTRVNDTLLIPERPKTLHEGDRIDIGDYRLVFTHASVVAQGTTAERTAAHARRLVQELLAPSSPKVGLPRLVLLDGPGTGTSVDVPPPPARLVIGRGESVQLRIEDDEVSREHAEVIRDLDGVLLRDLDSKNGIVFDGERVAERRLHDLDECLIGTTRVLFEDPAEESIQALGAQADTVLPRRGDPRAETSPSRAAPEEAERPAKKRARRERTTLGPDLLIYLLAAVVLVSSVAALLWLLRGG